MILKFLKADAPIRRYAEKLSRGVVFRRRLPPGGRRIFITPETALRLWIQPLDKFDPALLSVSSRLVSKDDIVWDIGANMGLFAFAAARLAGPNGRIIAVEPDCHMTELMHRSESQRPANDAPLTILPTAVSNNVGIATYHIANRSRSSNFLEGTGHSQTGGIRESRTVMMVTLDWMLGHFPAPDVLKIDVEGAELAVLSGASQVFGYHPKIVCEVAEESSEAVADLLHGAGFDLFDENMRPTSKAEWTTIALWAADQQRTRTLNLRTGAGAFLQR